MIPSSFRGPARQAGLFILAIFLVSGCTGDRHRLAGKNVVQVNEHAMTSREFAVQLGRRLKDLDALSAKDPLTIQQAKNEILKNFILRSLIVDWTKTKGLEVSDAVLDKEVEKIRKSYPDDLSFRRSLAVENMSFSEWREALRATLIERTFFEHLRSGLEAPNEIEVKAFFDGHKDQFRKRERIYVRQILVDEESKAELLRAELKGKDFAQYAKKYSSAPEASAGGLIGWIEKGTVEVFDAAFSQPLNTVGEPLKSPYGFHLIRVEKRIPASPGSLDEARPEIVATLRAQREQAEFVKWLDSQIRSSKILKDEALIRAMTVETKVKHD